MCYQDDNTTKISNEESGHEDGQEDFQRPLLLDAQEQEANRNLQKTNAQEESNLGVPPQHVVVNVLILGQVPAVSAIAVEVDLSDLDPISNYAQDCDNDHGIVIKAECIEGEANKNSKR